MKGMYDAAEKAVGPALSQASEKVQEALKAGPPYTSLVS